MWAQLITATLKPGHERDLEGLYKEIQAVEQPGSGLVRSFAMQDQRDPSRVYMLVVFESEEQARAREDDPRRQAGNSYSRKRPVGVTVRRRFGRRSKEEAARPVPGTDGVSYITQEAQLPVTPITFGSSGTQKIGR